jgi:hypothetical protein
VRVQVAVVATVVAALVAGGCGGDSVVLVDRRAREGTVEEFCAVFRRPQRDIDMADDDQVRLLSASVAATPHPPELVHDADLHIRALDILSARLLEVPPEQRGEEGGRLLATDARVRAGKAAADRIVRYGGRHC